ncbi:DUF2272 domain-containing protein [Luteimonas sp. BDR2-5]|uniref:DUF2272 domain-containing protein n=1 Tax=Proluteimonas luteida TaxID=2878685 RepID=UPI001E2C5040|nr:DUF2272 domain-containing protein [Luteimonas sp. BDR2-5]MCD9028557.1 DUF2272 domain-containing protein [Luteimonas sp. BDR2-5]
MSRYPQCLLLSVLLLLASAGASAADPCPLLRMQVDAPDPATRLAAAACEEHQLWHRPFIDASGGLAGSQVREAETALLTNGEQAWRRVAGYWLGAGLLPRLQHRPGADDCAFAAFNAQPSAACRALLVDVPWSAAFVSWTARRAALPGFSGAPSHVDYVRDAYRQPETSAYRVADPRTVRPARGDLLCYVRVANRIFGFPGLATLLSSDDGGLGMHCDVVVAAAGEGSAQAYLVGGNVLDGVTMRMLPLTPGGQFAALATRTLDDPPCTPDTPQACDANRQDWAVLLQLRPAAELATLQPSPPLVAAVPRPVPQPLDPSRPATPMCCVECSAGDGLPPCPGVSPGR